MRQMLPLLFFCFSTLLLSAQNKADSVALLAMANCYEDIGLNSIVKSQRWHSKKKGFEDPNLFFSLLVGIKLEKYKGHLTYETQLKIDSFLIGLEKSKENFRSRNGRVTYNFWQTHPEEHPLPNKKPLFLKDRYLLADDLDDAALRYTLFPASEDTLLLLTDWMNQFVGGVTKPENKKAPKTIRDYATYSTWFGDKMPTEYDICVLSNVLKWKASQNITWNAADSNAFKACLATVNDTANFWKKAYAFSPNYITPEIIVYHMAQLYEYTDNKDLLTSVDYWTSQPFYDNALLKENGRLLCGLPMDAQSEELVEFNYFVANVGLVFNYGITNSFKGIFYWPYSCESFYQVLLMENWVLKQG